MTMMMSMMIIRIKEGTSIVLLQVQDNEDYHEIDEGDQDYCNDEYIRINRRQSDRNHDYQDRRSHLYGPPPSSAALKASH